MGDYSIWVLEHAAVEKFPLSVMLYGPQYQGIRKLPYAYALLKGKGQTILIDTGYDHVNYGKTLALYGVSRSGAGACRMRRDARGRHRGLHHPRPF
jgi:hypothetical protein